MEPDVTLLLVDILAGRLSNLIGITEEFFGLLEIESALDMVLFVEDIANDLLVELARDVVPIDIAVVDMELENNFEPPRLDLGVWEDFEDNCMPHKLPNTELTVE